MRPIALPANTLASFYRGAGRIARFRGDPDIDPAHAEDWLASTTSRYQAAPLGLTQLGGVGLADLLAADPQAWLGPEYLARYGAAGSTLVKLLDAGNRLPLHVHPDRPFARRHLASDFGKTEAWLVLHADEGTTAHLGFARDVGSAELAQWVENQDVAALLGACNEVPMRSGDVFYCPGGIAHSIGAGALILEVQEMTDFSIMLEWRDFPIDHDALFLGLPRDTALQAVDRQTVDGDRLAALTGSSIRRLGPSAPGTTALLPSNELFRADQIVAGDAVSVELDPGFAVLVVNDGAGRLEHEDGSSIPVRSGAIFLVPHAAGQLRLSGPVSAIRCSSVV